MPKERSANSPKSEIYNIISDPKLQIEAVRDGLSSAAAAAYLSEKGLSASEILKALDVSPSTFFNKKEGGNLNSAISEKILRLAFIIELAELVLKSDAVQWLLRSCPALGHVRPIDMLDTEPGSRLVERTLISYDQSVYV